MLPVAPASGERIRMGVNQHTHGRRQGKANHLIVRREQLGALTLQPQLAGRMLALGAEAMTARQRHDRISPARVAVDGGGAAGRGAAAFDGREGLPLAGQQAVAVVALQLGVSSSLAK